MTIGVITNQPALLTDSSLVWAFSCWSLLIPFRFDYTAISLANRSGLPLSRE